jgi:hypothetical protein
VGRGTAWHAAAAAAARVKVSVKTARTAAS